VPRREVGHARAGGRIGSLQPIGGIEDHHRAAVLGSRRGLVARAGAADGRGHRGDEAVDELCGLLVEARRRPEGEDRPRPEPVGQGRPQLIRCARGLDQLAEARARRGTAARLAREHAASPRTARELGVAHDVVAAELELERLLEVARRVSQAGARDRDPGLRIRDVRAGAAQIGRLRERRDDPVEQHERREPLGALERELDPAPATGADGVHGEIMLVSRAG
jgi:hypothetical protein